MSSAYRDLISRVLVTGEEHEDRTGVGTLRRFGEQMRFDLREGFPLSGLRKIWWRAVVGELLWFLSGSCDVRDLQARGVTIWDAWINEAAYCEDEQHELGLIYGHQWRSWNCGRGAGHGVDQIARLVEGLRRDPQSRRHVVTAWNPEDVAYQVEHHKAPPPCHVLFQCSVSGDFLDLQLYQRSADILIGVPYNIASYSLLMHLLCHATGLRPRHFVHTIGDAHIYKDHQDAALTLLRREEPPMPSLFVKANAPREPWRIEEKHITLSHYQPHEAVAMPVAV
jgi:thymidylate synthase